MYVEAGGGVSLKHVEIFPRGVSLVTGNSRDVKTIIERACSRMLDAASGIPRVEEAILS